ncbi:ferredoxin [Actinomadura rubrisoli]|uniref:Ferredoxin n=1 Tax=Actinomadura rubrisoli TaxID=2530368 RepID=A0A4R5B3A0_9ACTN|nr:ferredoxin [Actinomadura rubrisoli]TDD79665.1 ferredoxin [Actinomadura rubrisoli]
MVSARLRADLTSCRGAGQCAFQAPALFDQDEEDGRVVILRPEPSEEEIPLAKHAVAACPNRALTIEGR